MTFKHATFTEQLTCRVATSDNGWTDDEIGFAWFKDIFVPQATERNRRMTQQEQEAARKAKVAAPQESAMQSEGQVQSVPDQDHSGEGEPYEICTSNEPELETPSNNVGIEQTCIPEAPTPDHDEEVLPPILLIYDGHGSHTTLEWITHARGNNVILYCLIPHTTHRLQPLDVGCFGPLQHAWSNRCDEILDETGEGMELKDVVREYFVARRKAFKETTILQAWKKSGLRPINPSIFTTADFAPSHSSSFECHAPSTFPSKMPHVPDASSDVEHFDPSAHALASGSSGESEFGCNSDDEHSGSEIETNSHQRGSISSPVSSRPVTEQGNGDIVVNPNENKVDELVDQVRGCLPGSSVSDFESGSDDDITDTPVQQPPPSESIKSPCFTRAKRQSNLRKMRYSSNVQKSHKSGQDRTQDPHEVIRMLTKELDYTKAQRDAAETHAVQSLREAAVWRYKYNRKKEKVKESSRRIHMSSRVTTNEQGLQEAEQDRKKKEEKRRMELEKQTQKEEKKKNDLVRRAIQGSAMVFSGSLSSKNKTDLEDLASALSLSIEGTKAVLVSRITTYFDDHPRFKEDDRYSGLFERTRGRKRNAPHDENINPQFESQSAQRRRLSTDPLANCSVLNQSLNPPPCAPSLSHSQPLLATSSSVRLEDLDQGSGSHNYINYTYHTFNSNI